MPDREKVMQWLKTCANGCEDGCPYEYKTIVYRVECKADLMSDAFGLLEEQDKIIKSLTEEKERLLSERIAELQHNVDALHAIMQDTILVNNAIEQRKGGEA